MALYNSDRPAFVDGVYIKATRANPAMITIPDNQLPSIHWTPLDEAAKKAHAALKAYNEGGKDAKFPAGYYSVAPKAEAKPAEAPVTVKAAPVDKAAKDIYPAQPPPKKRASDRDI